MSAAYQAETVPESKKALDHDIANGKPKPSEKAGNSKVTVRKLTGYLMRHKIRLILIFLTTVLGQIFTIAAPRILIKAVDKLGEGVTARLEGIANYPIDFEYIGKIVLFLGVLYLLSSLFMFLQRYLMATVTQKTILALRKELAEKLGRLPLKYYDGNAHGDILSRISNDVDTISAALKENVTTLISAFILFFGIMAMLLSINPLITSVTFGASICAFVFVVMIMSRSNTYYISQRKLMGEVNGYVEEMYQGHQIIKTYCRETNVITKFNELNEEYCRITWKAQYYSSLLNPGLYFILHFSYVIICVMGGIFAVNGRLSIGRILAFIQYSRDSFDPVLEIAGSLGALQAGVAAATRVFEILDQPEELPDSVAALSIGRAEGKVLFEAVDFGYQPGLTVIDGLNLVVNPGQTVALVGPTGVGKTTLINLLMRFYERNGGKIMIDGVDIAALKREELRGFFGIVMQDPWLFSGTIKDNIAYGKKDASESEIMAAAQAAYAYHFIKTLPDGFDTVLKEDAANISQGQKQLLTIARAILTDPTILILDEATSSIDTRTELCIQRAIKNLMQGRTCFVIAHRLSTIKAADRILVMKEGRVIEQGNQEELLEKKGFYSELYNCQYAVD